MMQYIKQDTSDSREITLPEKVLNSNRDEFLELIGKFIETNLQILILNFDKTIMIDSAGLGFLLIAQQETRNSKRELILKNPKLQVKKSFFTMNFDKIFKIQ